MTSIVVRATIIIASKCSSLIFWSISLCAHLHFRKIAAEEDATIVGGVAVVVGVVVGGAGAIPGPSPPGASGAAVEGPAALPSSGSGLGPL